MKASRLGPHLLGDLRIIRRYKVASYRRARVLPITGLFKDLRDEDAVLAEIPRLLLVGFLEPQVNLRAVLAVA